MQNHNQIRPNRALAVVTDGVYASNDFEQMFDTMEAGTHEHVQVETTPHRLTQMALAGAGNPTSTTDLLMTLALIKHQCGAIATHPDVLRSSDERAVAALVCARYAAAHLAAPLADLTVDDRYDIIHEWFQCADDEPRVEEFWTLLSTLLFAYAGRGMDLDWDPAPGLLPEDEVDLPMPVWQTETGRYVCDLLVFLTPWDNEEDIRQHVETAMDLARVEFGEEFGGIRVVPVLASYLTRWLHPDGTWEMWFDDVPNMDDLIDEALSNEMNP